MNKQKNIFPHIEGIIKKDQKEAFLKQKALVVWMTGLSGAGKTTIANFIEKELYKRGYFTQIFDGDYIRDGLNQDLDFTIKGRTENIRRIAEVCKLFVNCGVIVFSCFVSPTKKMRDLAKSIIGEENFIEVYVNSPLIVCEKRDTKGLYARARSGEIKNLTGVNAIYEAPINPDIELKTDVLTIEQTVEKLIDNILPKITYSK
ncbi:MAG: adenylyl-sulfate kinase [Bacteroidetes bacterium]|nr:adenylyl-sulfate kinase [Bacteroidota bacterium]